MTQKYDSPTQLAHLRQYFELFFKRESMGWLKTLLFYNIYIPFVLIGLIGLAIYINPLPPKTAYLAIGQDGSSYQEIAQSYQSFFKKNNINLELIPTNGLGQGLKGLHAKDSKINASFLTVGVANEKQYPGLVSLGSVQYAPIWIFYKGSEIKVDDPLHYLLNKKVSIGTPGSATNILFRQLSKVSVDQPFNSKNTLELSHKEGADLLHEGKIDALFIVDSEQSDTVEELIKDPAIRTMNFPLAEAYMKKLPFLRKLVIPKGSRNIENVDPPHDITILASTTNLLVEEGTHRAIQWAFLLAARDNNHTISSFFASPDYFPKDIDKSFPVSPIAQHFYQNGTPSIFNYMPIWIASLLDGMWVYILAIITLVYPSKKFIESVRLYPAESLMNKFFINARILDEALLQTTSEDEINKILTALDGYERSLYDIYLYGKNARFYFNQKNAINTVRTTAKAQLLKLEHESSTRTDQ